MILHHLKKKKKYSTKDVENKIICGETLNVLKTLPDKSVQTIGNHQQTLIISLIELISLLFDLYYSG